MKSRITKISLFSGLVLILALWNTGSQGNFSESNMNSLLTRAEMERTFGSSCYDCTHTYPREDICSGDECPGCASDSTDPDCGTVTYGSGTTVWHCTSEATPDATCHEDKKVNCTDLIPCNEDGGPVNEMTCGPNGTCTGGDEWCVECKSGTPFYSSPEDKVWTYECY